MKTSELARDLLLNKTCESCIYGWGSGCAQGDAKDTGKWLKRYPPEHTCKKWRPYE